MKGQIHITDFDNMPFYMLHNIYYRYWMYVDDLTKKEEEAKKGNKQAGAALPSGAMEQMLEDMEDNM